VALAFRGERVGELAATLLPHALERFAVEGGLTLHVESAGTDDHHVAEAAFKALGVALRQACAQNGAGVRSTKGAA
jgi:imidazoleglycerol-phosphate dehydratase